MRKWIEEYCKRHKYIIMEIDYNRRIVFYYLEGQNVFEDYTDFNYIEIDLFS
ncbi:hypothetical protein [Clostridium botulinum]|uniref:hypothetical protein n=1 Tax=Clostridium botulinum TaxID=1491 RepID=UPI003DA62209